MRLSTIVVATLGPAGISCTASGFLNSCSKISLTNLEGDPGRSIMLQAYCKANNGGGDHWTELDLNTCFGWSAYSCNFESPPAGHFTDSCAHCAVPADKGDDYDGTFACRGPCNESGQPSEAFRMFNLSKCTVFLPTTPPNRRDRS